MPEFHRIVGHLRTPKKILIWIFFIVRSSSFLFLVISPSFPSPFNHEFSLTRTQSNRHSKFHGWLIFRWHLMSETKQQKSIWRAGIWFVLESKTQREMASTLGLFSSISWHHYSFRIHCITGLTLWEQKSFESIGSLLSEYCSRISFFFSFFCKVE